MSILAGIVMAIFGAAACGEEGSLICGWVAERTGSETWATLANYLFDRPLRIVFIIFMAFVVTRLIRRAVSRFGNQVAERSAQQWNQLNGRGRNARGEDEEAFRGRAALRVTTIVSILSSLTTVVVWSVASFLILGEFSIDLAPLLAGAGVLGVALGFGAQSVVADFLSGFFMLIEDQFGVGDVIDVGEANGVVEAVSLRVTTLRDVNGTVWHIRNSEIRRVANKSQLWSRAVLDIEVAYDTDVRRAEGIIQRVADQLWRDTGFTKGDIIEPPEVWGVERLAPDGVVIRLVVKTDPAEQWVVARELRIRIKDALEEAGIEIPFPQRTVWLRQDEPVTPRGLRPNVDTAPIRLPHDLREFGPES